MALSPEQQVWQALREAREPLTTDQLLEHLPASVRAAKPKPRQWLTNSILKPPVVGRVRRGAYVYLPDHVDGSTLRVPLVGSEADDGRLYLGQEVAAALWLRAVDWHYLPPGLNRTCALPNGARATLTWKPRFWRDMGQTTLISAEFQDWLRGEPIAAGDSLLFHVTGEEDVACRVTCEPLAARDREQVSAKNRRLADAVEAVMVREVRRPLNLIPLALWLLARDFYQDPCPPDPLLPVLLLADTRFTMERDQEIAMATKWDQIVIEEDDFVLDLFQLGREDDAGSATPEEQKLSLAAHLPPPLSTFAELTPWLVAVGYDDPLKTPPDEDAEEEAGGSIEQVYRVRVALAHRKSIWRVFEVSDEETLEELDRAIRHAFQHDTMDHLSEFSVRAGGHRRTTHFGHISPFGDGPGNEVLVGNLCLEVGDTLHYVYDFGDHIGHTVTVEAVQEIESDVDYPREVARNTPRYQSCVTCAEHGKKAHATWFCLDCSNEYDHAVNICDACHRAAHDEHDTDRILY
jgi:Plasmid pRiA4b ORF-3-like protein